MNPEPEVANPYVGLRPFEQADSLYFFGRGEQTMELLEQLYQSHFLAVVGSSGCGKSSLIRAGLIPALLGGFLVEERDAWQIAIMKPSDAPLRNLAVAFCQAFGKAPSDAEIADLHETIVADHIQAVISYLRLQLGANTNLLLLIDQFEEIFSFRGTDKEEQTLQLSFQQRRERAHCRAEADDFVDLMLGLKAYTQLPVYIVLTMRTDFLGDCDLFYGLPEAMNESRYLVPRLTRQQLRQAIEGPARLSQTSLTPRLLDRLLNQLGERADRLPVLQHALLRTWDIWQHEGQTGPIDLEHYEAAGTLRNALSQHADEALRPHNRDTTARIFKCLTDTDPNHRRVRRPARLSELAAVAGQSSQAILAILERFREGGRNFLVISASADADDQRVDISHESLIRQWDALKVWVDEERESRNQFLDLVYRGHEKLALLQEPDLQIALHWRETTQPTAAWAKRYSTCDDDFDVAMQYLDHSQQAKEKAVKRRRKQRLFLLLAVIMLALILILSNVYQNVYPSHFHLGAKEDLSKNVELHQGNPTTWDIFDFREYLAETDYQRSQIEPAALFNNKKINDYNKMNAEVIETFKPIEKLRAYWKSGNTEEAFSAIRRAIEQHPERQQEIVSVMSGFRSLETIEELQRYLFLDDVSAEGNNRKYTWSDRHGIIVDTLSLFPNTAIMEGLLSEIKQEKDPSRVRRIMVEVFESISHTDFSDGNINKIIKSSLTPLLEKQSTVANTSQGEESQDQEEEKRVSLIAARTLMRLGGDETAVAVDQLILLASDRRLGQEALEALTGSRDEKVVAFLKGRVDKEKSPWMRRRIIEALAQIGGADVVEELKSLIANESVPIRQNAVQALGQIGTPFVALPLIERLKDEAANHNREAEDELPVERSIVEALGRLGNNSEHNNEALTYFLENMLPRFNDKSDHPMVRTTTEALGRIGNATTFDTLMNNTSNLNKIIIIDALEALGDIRAIDYLKKLLKEEASNAPKIQQRTVVALGRLGDASAVMHLKRLLHTNQDRLNIVVMDALGQLGHKDALELLQKKVVEKRRVDRQGIIYLSALKALGRFGDSQVLDDVTAWLQRGDSLTQRDNLESMVGASMAGWIARQLLSKSGEGGNVRQAAVEVLGEFDSIRPVNLLLARLSDGSILARRGAARALGRLGSGDIRVVDLLIVSLRDGDSGVRQNAAEALGQLGNPKVVAPLIALLQDSQGDVRRAAAEALGRLGNDRALQPLLSGFESRKKSRNDGVEEARRAALLAYAKIGRKSRPEQTQDDIRAVFDNNDEHKRVKLAAAVVLLELQSPGPFDATMMQLLQEYADGSQSISTRREVSEMLGEFPSEPGRQILLTLLEDTNLSVRETALKALGQSKDQDVLPMLHKYLRSDNFRLQEAAAEALGAIASAASIDDLAVIVNASDPVAAHIDDLAAIGYASAPRVSVEISIPTRLACLNALYNIAKNPETDDPGRQKVLDKMSESVEKKENEAILGMRTYHLLGDLLAHQALNHLQKRLDQEVASRHKWRLKRDALEEQAQAGTDNPETAKLKPHLVFELAYNIARIDPSKSGLSLLDHDLADIRQGAWQGLGRVGNVALINTLHQKLKTSNPSWLQKLWGNAHSFIRHAAYYQAIDHILLRLEAEGIDSQELERLKHLVPEKAPCSQKKSEELGICRRVKWTIEQLKAKDTIRE